MDRREFGKPKRIVIADTCAHCVRCAGEEFVRSERAQGRDTLFCAGCGAEQPYSVLLRQIAAVVIERSDRLLKEAEALRAAIRKPPNTP
jgi:hypothetical protein